MNSSRRDLANAIRALSMDAVEHANSGHPGMPMGMADIAEVLWNDYLKHSPTNPQWADRDRFVLSNGHGSMLLYSLLHLTGYDLSIEDIKKFRQLDSKTPGHPEYGETPGIETTTGPLGQGLANAVGMAIAERTLGAHFNKKNYNIVDHNTYVFVGDGCLMEGISHEACSLAGTLKLGKLIVFYDDNNISIDGDVKNWFTDDTPQRFQSYAWQVIPDIDGHDAEQIKIAIENARANKNQPTLICCKTKIGWGAPNKQCTEDCHGAPLGKEEIELTRKSIAWAHPPFEIPPYIYSKWNAILNGVQAENQWNAKFDKYKLIYPDLAEEFGRRMAGRLPDNWETDIEQFITEVNTAEANIASRNASQNALNICTHVLPELVGGSADLAGSNLTINSNTKPISGENAQGNYIYYGVREFAMSAISNGISLHRGFIPYCATFLMFSEYARNALRMSALMNARSLFVFTHDSIALGEDGPTHQPIEQAATLRLIPNMSVWRPADAVESTIAWKDAIENHNGPSCLLFSRQKLPHIQRTKEQISNVSRGAYVLRDSNSNPCAIIIATGSEVSIALKAWEVLTKEGYQVRLVSMPNSNVFDLQSENYKQSVLPEEISMRVAIEAGVSEGWHKYVGLRGKIIGVDTFGKSAPGEELLQYFGITADSVVKAIEASLKTGARHKNFVEELQPA